MKSSKLEVLRQSPPYFSLFQKLKSGAVSAPTSNLPYELENTVGKDVMSIRDPLDLAFSIEVVEDVLNLNLLPGVQVH